MKPDRSDPFATDLVGRLARLGMGVAGGAIVVIGLLIAPLPGPLGVPVMVVGLMILLRSSFWARRTFVRLQRRHPRFVFPLRRLLRREPEVILVVWQQVIRLERAIVPRSWRFLRRARLVIRGRRKV
jgi:hypothetical protein